MVTTPVQFEQNVAKIQHANPALTEVQPVPVEHTHINYDCLVDSVQHSCIDTGSLLALYEPDTDMLAYKYAIVVLNVEQDEFSFTGDFKFTFQSTHRNGKIQAGHSKYAKGAADTVIRTTLSDKNYQMFPIKPDYVRSVLPNTPEQKIATVSNNI